MKYNKVRQNRNIQMNNFNNANENINTSHIQTYTYRGVNQFRQNIQEKVSITRNKCFKFLIIAIAAFLVFVGIVLGLIFGIILPRIKDHKKDKDDSKEENGELKDNQNNVEKPLFVTKEVVMKALKPSFTISSKVNTLIQLSLKSIQKYNTISKGEASSYSIFTKAKYDIYTISEISSGENQDFYSTKYSTAITLNSFCSQLSSDSLENDCEYEEYLNLNFREENNLRRNEEDDLEIFKQAILPICIIEHSNTNLIFTVSCPETLSNNMRNDIILAFKSIKPESLNGINDEEKITGTKIEQKDDKIYIESFNKNCNDYDGDPNKNMTCELIKNIITDKDGNLISSKKISTTETILDENNTFFNNITYIFEDITKQNANDLNPHNFKLNLDSVLDITKSFMKKENYIPEGNFNEIIDDLINKNQNEAKSQNRRRNLEYVDNEPGVQEESVFEKTENGIKMNLNIKNDIGFGESAKAISIYNRDNIPMELSNNQISSKLNDTLNKFITLSKSGNKLAGDLFDKLNERILSLRELINSNISDLNDFLAFKDLQSIFDGTSAADDLENLPFKFIKAIENLYSSLDKLYIDIPYKIYDMKTLFEESISSFLSESHNLLYKIFNNLTEVTNILTSKKSKIEEISTYYLNHTDTSYISII